jgi:Uma2 family endonuclease
MATDPVDRTNQREWTVTEYMAIEDDEHRELIEGDLRMTPAPNTFHQRAAMDLGRQLANFIRERGLGECFLAPFDVVLSEQTVVQPDFVYVAADRFDDLYDGHGLTGAPDLVIEIISPGTERRDRIEKRRLYADSRVPWLILVEPQEQLAEVFRLDDEGQYVLDTDAGAGEQLTVGLFEQLEIDLGDVWFEEPDTDADKQT